MATAPQTVSHGLALGVYGGVVVFTTPNIEAKYLIRLPSTFLPLSECNAHGNPNAATK